MKKPVIIAVAIVIVIGIVLGIYFYQKSVKDKANSTANIKSDAVISNNKRLETSGQGNSSGTGSGFMQWLDKAKSSGALKTIENITGIGTGKNKAKRKAKADAANTSDQLAAQPDDIT